MRNWLVVAAEELEFSGILKRCGPVQPLAWPPGKLPKVQFGKEAQWKGDRWWLVANGPGAQLVRSGLAGMVPDGEGLRGKTSVDGIISTGFCGALDPSLSVGSIVVDGETPARCSTSFVNGGVYSAHRVIITAEEKRALFLSAAAKGAVAVDMEFAEVRTIAREWGVPVRAIRVVSDTAADSLPLDFNRYRDAQGRFSRGRITLAALGQPFHAIPGLLRLSRNCNLAADRLGEFFANSEF